MLVKDLMDDNKLDLNKPLLSVRRHHPSTSGVSSQRYGNTCDKRIPRIPRYKSDLKSGPFRNPGSVPFQWEQTPGLPKEDRKPEVQNQVAPKLPPGRCSKPNRIESKDPETEKMNGKEMSGERKCSSSGDCDEEFVDALDTFSISGSSYLNCSMSDFTGLDGNFTGGSFSTDRKTQGMIMERFLPAAKALASEKPKYSPRKQPLSRQHPLQQVKQRTLARPTLRYGPSFANRYSHFGKDAPGEDEEDEETYDHPSGCGFLPSLFKGSVFLNPVPGLSMRRRGHFPPAPPTRTLPESSASGSMTEAEPSSEAAKKKIQWICEDTEYISILKGTGDAGFGSLKTIQDTVSEKGSDSGSHVGERTVHVDTVQNFGTMSNFSSSSQDSGFDIVASLEDNKIIYSEDEKKLDASIGSKKHLLESVTFEKFNEKHIQLPAQQSASDSNDSEKKKYYKLPVPPPLPKCPTDSWLCRTRPSISKNAKEPFLASATNPQNHGFKVQKHNEEFV